MKFALLDLGCPTCYPAGKYGWIAAGCVTKPGDRITGECPSCRHRYVWEAGEGDDLPVVEKTPLTDQECIANGWVVTQDVAYNV